jgi:homoserine kinase type II
MTAAVPPSGHQNAGAAEMSEALFAFLDPREYRWSPVDCVSTAGGVNNVTKIVSVRRIDDDSLTTLVVRVYRNNNHTGRVAWEHLVLRNLNAAARRNDDGSVAELGFSFPTPRPNRTAGDQTYQVLSTGAASCVFEYIPGSLAKTVSPAAVGAASGTTSALLAHITQPLLCELDSGIAQRSDLPAPYHKLWDVHHAIDSRTVFLEVIAKHASLWFSGCSLESSAAFQTLVTKILALDNDIQHQLQSNGEMINNEHHVTHLIHGDLHYDNVLVHDDSEASHEKGQQCRVSAVLDFEFVSLEWRIMELAICLSKYLSEAEEDILPMYCVPFIKAFVHAYAEMRRALAAERAQEVYDKLNFAFSSFECSHFVDCIALRILSNVVFFVGRAVSGEDVVEGLTSRVVPYARRLQWLHHHGPALEQVLREACDAEHSQR